MVEGKRSDEKPPETWHIVPDVRKIEPTRTALENRMLAMGWLDEAENARVTMAFTEALTNAILHGNLGIPSSNKSGSLEKSKEYRVSPDYQTVDVTLTVTENKIEVQIQDHGKGFDTSKLPAEEDVTGANIMHTSGRGYFLMRHGFDSVVFEDEGRRVVMKTSKKTAGQTPAA
jgi:anti-sigma regulatory factor (Ser/Thr protein kinase)